MTRPPSADVEPEGVVTDAETEAEDRDKLATPDAEPLAPAPAPATSPTDRALCEGLVRSAVVRVEDVQGGASLILTPANGAARASAMEGVREGARSIEKALHDVARRPVARAEERCELFELGRQGARAAIAEGPDTIRVLITTSDPAMVQKIRSEARTFAMRHAAP